MATYLFDSILSPLTPDSSRDIDQVSGAGDTRQVAFRVTVSLWTNASTGYSELVVFSPIQWGWRLCSDGRARLDKKKWIDFLSRVHSSAFRHSFFNFLSQPPFWEIFGRELRLSFFYRYKYVYIYTWEFFFLEEYREFFFLGKYSHFSERFILVFRNLPGPT